MRSSFEENDSLFDERYASQTVIVGEFHCERDDPRFGCEFAAQRWPSITFPRAPIGFRLAGAPAFVGHPAIAALFNVGQPYSRRSIADGGSYSDWIEVRPDILCEVAAICAPSLVNSRVRSPVFLLASAPVPPRVYALQRQILLHLRRGNSIVDLEVEEAAIEVVERLLNHANELCRLQTAAQRTRDHAAQNVKSRDAVNQVSAILAESCVCPPALGELSSAVGYSAFHLCTLFRRKMGHTIREHLNRIRIGKSLFLLEDRDARCVDIAYALGFATESHFSDTFARLLGVRPRAFRRLSTDKLQNVRARLGL